MKKIVISASMIGALLVTLPANAADANKEALVKQGEHIVTSFGCADCHTPKIMGPNGPEEDNSRKLSGHPASMELPPAPVPSGPWVISITGDLTAWTGPWGTSFTRNLTPDKETGLGDWTEQNFIDTIRSGRRLGKGRALLPPMPWPAISHLTDDELKAVFAYLQSLPPIKNPVPEPIPPPAAPAP